MTMKRGHVHIVVSTTLFALLLWISLSMNERYQVQVKAPLRIENLPPGKAVSAPIPREVQLTFDDIGWKLAKLWWNANLTWIVDLSSLATTQRTFGLQDIAEQIGTRIGVQPTAMKPESFSLSFDSLASKRIPVVPAITLVFREGYGQVGDVTLAPDSVIVSGARTIVRTLRSWPTAPRIFTDVRQSLDATLPLADTLSGILTFTPDEVQCRVEVQQFAEKTFSGIPVELVSIPHNRDVLLSAPTVDLVVRGGVQQLGNILPTDVRAVVEYRVILADTSGIIEPEVIVPKGIQVVRKTPDRLQYVIRKK
jgi:hypothetical protein